MFFYTTDSLSAESQYHQKLAVSVTLYSNSIRRAVKILLFKALLQQSAQLTSDVSIGWMTYQWRRDVRSTKSEHRSQKTNCKGHLSTRAASSDCRRIAWWWGSVYIPEAFRVEFDCDTCSIWSDWLNRHSAAHLLYCQRKIVDYPCHYWDWVSSRFLQCPLQSTQIQECWKCHRHLR